MGGTINRLYQEREVEEVFVDACKCCDLVGTDQCEICSEALTNNID